MGRSASMRVKPREVAERLGVSKPTAISLMRSKKIPGAEMIYVDDDGRQHWRIDRQAFEDWLATLRI